MLCYPTFTQDFSPLQAHGGAGMHDDLPLASFYTWARVLRLADGPDEVHLRTIARREYKKAAKL